MTAHVETGEPLPRALFDKMLAAKNFQSGLQIVRQIEFALFDMHLHHDFDPAGAPPRLAVARRGARGRWRWCSRRRSTAFRNSFSHIFAGGYAAGYYSYKWAEVLSADAFSLFEERGVLDPETGSAFVARYSPSAAAGPRSNRSSRSAAARRASTHCCATTAWRADRGRVIRCLSPIAAVVL